MTSPRPITRRLGDPLRRTGSAALVLACVSVAATLAGSAGAAPAAKENLTISRPEADQTVKGTLRIEPQVESTRGPYLVKISIDRKLYNQQSAETMAEAQTPVPIDTRELKNGHHKLTVAITDRGTPQTTKQSLTFVVKNKKGHAPSGAGQRPPKKNLKDFQLASFEGFDVPAPLGSINTGRADTTVYTGASGTPWRAYPPSFTDAFLHHPYRPTEVLSVHDSALDFWLHPIDGKTSGASVSPILPGGTQYQTYGRYSIRARLGNAPLSEYIMAFLLWPQKDKDYMYAESDFPENQLLPGRQPVTGYHHFALQNAQEYIISTPVDLRSWHTYTQKWIPGLRRYYLDGKLLATTTTPVWSGPMRWQFQIQSYLDGVQSGHLYVDWAAVWAYVPGTKPS